jgi:uncharacterized protein
MRRADAAPALCVEIHDVAPATWPACARLLERMDAAGAGPATLLVVPDFHGRGRADRDPAFRAAIDARIARGDEVSLHGYDHLDAGAPCRTPAEWLRRRVRTLSEGEFAALSTEDAEARLRAGIACLAQCGWQVAGFVPPAWLLGTGARAALHRLAGALGYCATRDAITALRDEREVPTLTLSYAAFTTVRRALSRPVLDVLATRATHRSAVRLALHPVDAGHPSVLAHWERLMRRLAATHTPRTVRALMSPPMSPPNDDFTPRARAVARARAPSQA